MLGFDRHTGRAGANGPPVLLLHCWGHDRSMWDPQIDGLRDLAREVIVPDLPGHGASPLPPGPFGFDDLTRPVLDLLDHLDLGPVVTMGLSLGAAIAVQLAVAHGNRVAGLLLADSALPDGPGRARRAADRILTTPLDDLLDAYDEVLFTPEAQGGADPSTRERWRRVAAAVGTDVLAAVAVALHTRGDPTAALLGVTVPTLIVHGELDAAVPPGRRDDYLRIPGSRRVEIPGAGHLANLDRPTEFSALAEEFVRDVGRSGPR